MKRLSIGTAAAVALVLLGGVLPTTGARAGVGDPWSVTASPTVGIGDGQTLAITVKTTAAFPIYAAEAHVCRAGVPYAGSASPHIRPNHDFDLGGVNCPLNPLSSSGDTSAVASTNIFATSATADGEVFTFRSGTGVVDWASPSGPQSLTCDADHPCSLVVELQGGPGSPTWFPVVIPLTYHDDDPISGCGGAANGIVASGGSDRLFDAWVGWTLGSCGTGGAPTRATFDGEGEAARGFADGTLDLAYTGLGADAQAALAPDLAARPSVAVPLALNAAVLAVGNGKPGNNGKKVPYSDLKLTLDEVTALVSGGQFGIDPYLDAIYARNPELAATGFFDTNSPFITGAGASADSVSLFATARLDTLRPGMWRVPDVPSVFGLDAGRSRGTDASLALADPGYQNALTLLTGRPALQRNLVGLGGTDFGGIWVLTDLATATSLGLTPVQIEDANGDFVAPTPASLLAAVPSLQRTGTGALRPDPAQVHPAGTGAYPLTFVEYALAPAEPLIDVDCVTRPPSQALLAEYLDFVAGPGQDALPPGFVSLPTPLRDEATAAVAQVGQAEVTGPCAGRVTDPVDPTLPPPAPGTVDPPATPGQVAAPGAASFAATRFGPTAAAPTGVLEETATATSDPQAALELVAAPRHLGALGEVNATVTMAALLGIAMLVTTTTVGVSRTKRRSAAGAPPAPAAP